MLAGYGGKIMGNSIAIYVNNEKRLKCMIGFLLVIIGFLVAYIFYDQHLDAKGKPSPVQPSVMKQLTLAKSLQKQGKLLESTQIFEQFAIQGYPDAMFYLAKAYTKGWGVKPDLIKARWHFLNAVEYDFSYRGETAYQLGILYQKSAGPDCNTIAVEWFKKSIKWKYLKAAVSLGTHYEKGYGVPKDLDKAIYYYEMATHDGITIAALKHARIISSGNFGVPRDIEYAATLLKFSVENLELDVGRGKASAAKTLGRLYRDGISNIHLPEYTNLEKSIFWFRRSSDLDNIGAKHDLAKLLLLVDEDRHHKEAITLLQTSANSGHGGAAASLGRMHLAEKYNLPKAGSIPWFNMGVNAGHTGAIKELAVLYYQGELVDKDINMAIKLLQKGENKGHSPSKRLLIQYRQEKITQEQEDTGSITKV